MTNVNTEGLPVEMQQRIAEIIEKAKANSVPQAAPSPQSQRDGVIREAPAAPIQRPPSLMDHVVALRQEVAAMRQEMATVSQQVAAAGQVTEAVGGAVGQLYNMFCAQTETTNTSPTYASQFQQQQPSLEDDY